MLSKPRNISNSEVTSWLACRRMYFFQFFRNLEPKEMSVPLYRGNLGHNCFQVYAEARLSGGNHDAGMRASEALFLRAIQSKEAPIDKILEVQYLFNEYMGFHQGWNGVYKFRSVEQRVDLPLTDTITMPIRYDVEVEEVSSGRILIGDYKFTYDFWSQDDHDLNGQMPKYITVLQANGRRVDGGFLEEIRTRPLGKEKRSDPRNCWKRTMYYPTAAKKQQMLTQHIAASMEIDEYWNLPEKEREAKTIPLLSKHGACKFCSFKSLCNSMNNGAEIEVDIQLNYQENQTYGYNLEDLEL